jgi:NADP-dependent 3-hydroxy acid dehydrogenase YdfG
MRVWEGKTWWLVGASEGLGRALAVEMSRAGASLVLSARDLDRLEALAAALPGPARAVAVDVTDAASVEAAAAAVGPVDGLVWLAGAYWPMTARDWDAGKVAAMLDTNIAGAARVLGAVVPGMVARGRGHVVLTGSLAGFRALPGALGYGASKAGVIYLAEELRIELAGTGVTVQLANPGYVRTRLTAKNDFAMPAIMEPEAAAKRMLAHMQTDRFALSFPFWFSLVFRLAPFLPHWLWARLVR